MALLVPTCGLCALGQILMWVKNLGYDNSASVFYCPICTCFPPMHNAAQSEPPVVVQDGGGNSIKKIARRRTVFARITPRDARHVRQHENQPDALLRRDFPRPPSAVGTPGPDPSPALRSSIPRTLLN
ncbi:hypothetical protein OH76DRAFT_1028294 [Lentinus brumalis]|uniref:Uncharacterized protein n=1 Tax=Lentinus brumalis TaxID=2498619 RepID=A0A371CXQ9_9APHY|nr:hypothetical protein OH76DRAFT_1028294 [Polyporus brumalis]